MYLVKLFRYNKWLFAAIVCFFAIQLFINFKRGLTATPFLHYGMYSGKFFIPQELTAWKIYVNGEPLNLTNNLPETNDRILVPLHAYQALPVNGTPVYYSHIQKYLSALPIATSINNYESAITETDFKKWYKDRLQQIIKRDIKKLAIYQLNCTVNEGNFLVTDSTAVLLWN